MERDALWLAEATEIRSRADGSRYNTQVVLLLSLVMFNGLIIIVLFPVLIAVLILYDRLLWLEYFSYRSNWEQDGKPHGFFWVPPEARFAGGWLVRFGSSAAHWRKSFAWIFSTPEWMQRDKKARRLVFWLRTLVLIWNLGLGGAIAVHAFW